MVNCPYLSARKGSSTVALAFRELGTGESPAVEKLELALEQPV